MAEEDGKSGTSTGSQIAGLEESLAESAAETDAALTELSQQAEEGVEELRQTVRALAKEVRLQRQALNWLIKILKGFFNFRVAKELAKESMILASRRRMVDETVQPGQIHEDYRGQPLPEHLKGKKTAVVEEAEVVTETPDNGKARSEEVSQVPPLDSPSPAAISSLETPTAGNGNSPEQRPVQAIQTGR